MVAVLASLDSPAATSASRILSSDSPIQSRRLVQIAPSLAFYYVAAFAAGLFLAWRFPAARLLGVYDELLAT